MCGKAVPDQYKNQMSNRFVSDLDRYKTQRMWEEAWMLMIF